MKIFSYLGVEDFVNLIGLEAENGEFGARGWCIVERVAEKGAGGKTVLKATNLAWVKISNQLLISSGKFLKC